MFLDNIDVFKISPFPEKKHYHITLHCCVYQLVIILSLISVNLAASRPYMAADCG